MLYERFVKRMPRLVQNEHDGKAGFPLRKGVLRINFYPRRADAAAEKADLLKGDAVAHLLAEDMLFEGERVVKVLP